MEGWRLCGFYCGTGGHLHNVGVVLMKASLSSSSFVTTFATSMAGAGESSINGTVIDQSNINEDVIGTSANTAESVISPTVSTSFSLSSSSSNALFTTLLHLCDTYKMSECGLLNYHKQLPGDIRHADLFTLIGMYYI